MKNKLVPFFTVLVFFFFLQVSFAQIIPQGNWKLVYVDSQEVVRENGAAVNAFDGSTGTFWHTQWYGASPPPPHEIQIDLGQIYDIEGFRYLPRQDGEVNGRIGQYEFYVSIDGTNWGNPVATGTFANDALEKEVLFTPKTGRFICLRALTEVNGNPWTSMAEINVLGNPPSGNFAPNGVIDNPAANVTINVGDQVNFAGTGSDPDNNLPLSFLWQFGTGSDIPNSMLEDPGIVQFNIPGTFTVTFTVTDALGLSDSTLATRIITVRRPVIPQTNWSLKYVDSQELIKENGAAVNAFDGKMETIWHTQYNNYSPPPPHEIQIDLRQIYDIEGFRYLPRQDGGVNGRIGQYEFYVSIDGTNWGNPVATGTFANDALEKEVLFTPKTGRFICLRALTEVNGNPWTSMAEINVLVRLFSGNIPPIAKIEIPFKDMTINKGDMVPFAGTGSDPDGNLPLSYHWHFGTGSGITDSNMEDPDPVQFALPGTYIVTLTVTDAMGLQSLPDTRIITVRSDPVELIPYWINVTFPPFDLHVPEFIVNPVLTARDVTDVPASFIADPYMFHENNVWFMFFEVFNNNSGHGEIGLATSSDGLRWGYKQIVLDEGFHLSDPLVFKYNGKYYMIPESYETNQVRIYESTNFPYDWHYISTLLSDKGFVDPVVFWFNNVWWMFVTDTSCSNLYLYYSDDLLSGWVEHTRSPIIINDASKTRPGGRSFVFDYGRIIRLTQKDDVIYGEQVRAFEVDILTKTDYAEHEIPESPILNKTGSGWNASGMHHADCWWTGTAWICSSDGWNQGYDWAIGLYTAETTHMITAIADQNGSINPSGTVVVNQGASQTFTVTATTEYSIADVKVDGTSVGAVSTYTFNNVTTNHTISASFTMNTYNLTVTKAGTGTGIVTSSPAGINCGSDCSEAYNAGTVVTLTASPDTSSTFTGWSGGCTGTGTCTVTMNAAKTVTATFTLKTYTITATAGTGGSITPSGSVSVNHGASQTFTVTATTGYSIADVKVDGTSVGAVSTYTFSTVTANRTIAATFAINTFTVTALAPGGNGTIVCDPTSVSYGGSSQCTITPSAGYKLESLTDNNTDVLGSVSNNIYTISNVISGHTLIASFAVNTSVPIAVASVSSGSINSGSTLTISHTVSGSNRLMLVGVSLRQTTSNYSVNSITYNGIALTRIGSVVRSTNAKVEIWRLIAPAVGTYNVVITFNSSVTNGAVAGVMTFTGVNQTVPLGTFASANGNSSTASVNVSSAAGEMVFGVVDARTSSSLTQGAAQTERWDLIAGSSNSHGAGSTQTGAPSVSASWKLGSSANWAIAAVPIRRAAQ